MQIENETQNNDHQDSEVLDELIIPLKKPVTLGDQTYHELQLREPTMIEIENFTKNLKKWEPLVAMNFFIAVVAGVPKPVIDQIGGRDGKRAREFLSNFL